MQFNRSLHSFKHNQIRIWEYNEYAASFYMFLYRRKRSYPDEECLDEVKTEPMDDDTASSWTDVETRVKYVHLYILNDM